MGESSIMVDVPRYGTDEFSVGFSLNYAHRPLVLGVENEAGEFQTLRVLIEHQLLGHIDLSARFCDCTTFSLTLPIALAERGDSSRDPSVPSTSRYSLMASAAARSASEPDSLGDVGLLRSSNVGDPRLGMMVRLYGRPDESPLSVSLGGYLWVPLSRFLSRPEAGAGDQEFRARPMLVLAGHRQHIQWSLAGSFLFRPEAPQNTLPAIDGSVEGSELRVGTHVSYTDKERGFAVGPEVQLSTLLIPRDYAFKPFYTSLEALIGLHFKPSQVLQVDLSAGAGLLRRPGTPDLRLLLRVSYNPVWKGQGSNPRASQVPPSGGLQAPVPALVTAHTTAPQLSAEPCSDSPQEASPGSLRLGCPASDADQDTVLDSVDQCPETPWGQFPDPEHLGCPASDGDQDTVPDSLDACPDEPGAPALEQGRNGCPGLVEVKGDRLLIRKPIVFGLNTDTVLEESFPVLQAMTDALRASPWIKKIRIEGHTDNQGSAAANQTLSVRRARSVMRWLQTHGVEPERMEFAGYGQSRPVAGNDTEQGRAANRRVDIVIIEPPPAPSSGAHP
ncbi:OmpA family protein [Archangium sp.]|uniref:OmpA family protein n=1 Tax=Archangium sp. TaxID=1872627 RepID=UPI003899B122